MKILALSDISAWDRYSRLVETVRPRVTVLAGDLTSDGGAEFWRTALEVIPGFRADRRALRKRLGVTTGPRGDYEIVPRETYEEYRDAIRALERQHRTTAPFLAARKRLHVDKFYAFLRHAGKRSTVLVVKGDHDDDFPADYDGMKIDAIPGCMEISGKTATVDGLTFLGLGYEQAGFRRPLRQFIRDFRGSVDVVIAHPPHENVPIVAELKPRLLIRGHFGTGRYSIGGIPSVFTASGHATITLGRTGAPRIRSEGKRWEGFFRERWAWLQPYPNQTSLPAALQ
jgi:3',5'-cyclic AMP phosphodiesterase CpdA